MRPQTKGYLLDSSALVMYLNREKGWEKLEPYLGRAAINTINYSEALLVVLRKRGEAVFSETLSLLDATGLRIIEFLPVHARMAAAWDRQGEKLVLSLGDKACLATAGYENMEVVTADRVWKKLMTDVVIHCIR